MQHAVPFEQFMGDALYGPHGFYSAGYGHAGRRHGDFLTSPEVGPLFGAVVARYLDTEWVRLGCPRPFTFVDAGAGPGTLARAVLAAGPRCNGALRYVAVDISGPQRSRHPDGVESRSDLPGGPFVGVIFANELLDNLPFRLAVYDGAWREAYVEPGRDGAPTEVLSAPFDPPPPTLPPKPAHGARAPLQDAAHNWIGDARSRLAAGTVVAIDYAVASTSELAVRPWRDWLRTYRGHAPGGHYLAEPGTQDITTEVCVDQLPEPDAVRSQAQWLQLHGIAELVAEGKTYWAAHSAHPDLAAIRMRSRVAEAEALLDPAGLGAFTVLEWRAGLPSADPLR
jgi:SAM-dependent MidA family methyltransferase